MNAKDWTDNIILSEGSMCFVTFNYVLAAITINSDP